MWSTTWPEERRKEKLNKYAIPNNCQHWAVSKCNEDVWNVNLRTQMRSNDLGFHRIQNMIIRSASAVMYATDSLIQCKNKNTDIPFGSLIEQFIDVTGLLSHACHDLSQKRREAIKPALPKKLQKLVYNVPKDSKEVFGDDLEKRIKAIFAANNALTSHRITGRLRSFENNDRSKNFQGYQRGRKRRQRQPPKLKLEDNYVAIWK